MHPDTTTPDSRPFALARGWDAPELASKVAPFDIETAIFRAILAVIALISVSVSAILPALEHGPAVIPSTLPVTGLILALIVAVGVRDAKS